MRLLLYVIRYVSFYRYLRMSPERFDALLGLVEPLISKQRTNFREPISAAERLSVTLRSLATGESQQSLSISFRIGRATVSKVVCETSEAIYSEAIYKVLSPINLAPPSIDGWVKIAQEFEELWNLPRVIGALDGNISVSFVPLKQGHNSTIIKEFAIPCNV